MKGIQNSCLWAAALAVIGCKVVPEPSQQPISQTRTAHETTISTLHTAPAYAMMRSNLTKGAVRVKINGQMVGVMGPGETVDLVKYLKPGHNAVVMSWTSPVRGTGRIEFQANNSTARKIVSFTLPPNLNQKTGTYQVNLEVPAGTSVGPPAVIVKRR
jgi:hypothetical protein